MTRGRIIRGVFIGLILLPMAGWTSGYLSLWIGQHQSRYFCFFECDSGALNLYWWGRIRVETPTWLRITSSPRTFELPPTHREIFSRFQLQSDANSIAASIPWWFLVSVALATLSIVWWNTRPKTIPPAFPVGEKRPAAISHAPLPPSSPSV